MKNTTYILFFLSATAFVRVGVEKLFLTHGPSVFKGEVCMTALKSFGCYNCLQQMHDLNFVGFFRLLIGFLMLLKRALLPDAVMLVPLYRWLVMKHILMSECTFLRLAAVFYSIHVCAAFYYFKSFFLKRPTTWLY